MIDNPRRARRLGGLGLAVAAVLATAGCQEGPSLNASQDALVKRADTLPGITDVSTLAAPNGGMVIDAELNKNQIALAFPPNWNGDAVLFAHGYSSPDSSVAVAENPVENDPGMGLLKRAYAQGFAVGHSAYAKAGLGVEAGVKATLALRNFTKQLGARRMYIVGGSMGGSITMALIERYPEAFNGAVSACGVTGSWGQLFQQMIDLRLAYNYLTRGTDFALPGTPDARVAALSSANPLGITKLGDLRRGLNMKRIADPMIALMKAATANPKGREARIVRQLASIGGYKPEASSLIAPMLLAALGMSDFAETLGGQPYGNVGKVYTSPYFTPAEQAAFNKGVQRIAADPAAVANARAWYQPTGKFKVPLVSFHNRIDPVVPYNQAEILAKTVAAAGNQARFAAYTMPAMVVPLPIGGINGYAHCGFKPEELHATWRDIRNWVERGVRPPATLAGR